MLPFIEKHHCCAVGSKRSGRRFRTAAELALPGAVLLLIPKCPLCIVAYVAMISGIGLSVSTASFLRIGLIVICLTALLYLAASTFLVPGRRNREI